MKKIYIIIFLMACFSLCGCEKQHELILNETKILTEYNETYAISEEDVSNEQNVQDENGDNEYKISAVDYSDLFQDLCGCAVIYDFNENEYFVYNEEIANKQYSPYSTFKIVSTLMGLHNSVVMDENSKMNYDGTIYPIEIWNSNLTLDEAFETSCIWYFRQVIDAVGMNEVQMELDNLEYGNCDVSEWNGSRINPMDELNGFWLGSSLKISPMEQVQVMKKIFGSGSIYTETEVNILQDAMLYDEVNDYLIYGKTGTNQNEEGWYVGVVESEQKKFCFAIYIASQESTHIATGNVAREIVKSIFENMQWQI